MYRLRTYKICLRAALSGGTMINLQLEHFLTFLGRNLNYKKNHEHAPCGQAAGHLQLVNFRYSFSISVWATLERPVPPRRPEEPSETHQVLSQSSSTGGFEPASLPTSAVQTLTGQCLISNMILASNTHPDAHTHTPD